MNILKKVLLITLMCVASCYAETKTLTIIVATHNGGSNVTPYIAGDGDGNTYVIKISPYMNGSVRYKAVDSVADRRKFAYVDITEDDSKAGTLLLKIKAEKPFEAGFVTYTITYYAR